MVRLISKNNSAAGMVSLVSVLLISVVALAVAVSLLVFSAGQSQNDLLAYQLAQARAINDACLEQALVNIKNNPAFSGSYNLILDSGAGDYQVEQLAGGKITIKASAYVGSAVSRQQVLIDQLSSQINIVSWQPVADFN